MVNMYRKTKKKKKSTAANNSQKMTRESMEARNEQNVCKESIEGHLDKNENAEVVGYPCSWKSPAKGIINIAEFLERAKSYAHNIVQGKLLEDLQELKKIKKNVRLHGGLCAQ